MMLRIEKRWMIVGLCFGVCLSLSGCLGSQMLFEDNSADAYGNLADVPEIMPSIPFIETQQEQSSLQQDYEVMMKNHQDFINIRNR